MKLIVQIPCYNEEQTLGQTIADIPKSIEGIESVEILIIDDGSTDRTIEVAAEAGVDHIISNTANKGLAQTFASGLSACLERGADVIVTTDGDNQYSGASISDLVQPILDNNSDIVIGDRQTNEIEHFSIGKKLLQRVGSYLVRYISGVDVNDAVSGFRAYSREAALRTNVFSNFSYTVETVIHAGISGMSVSSVPVATNSKTRDSRLFTNIPSFLGKQIATLIRSYIMYRSLKVFSVIGTIFLLIGLLPVLRFLILFLLGEGDGKIQSLVIGGVFITLSFITFAIALLSDAVAINRRLLESTLISMRRQEFGSRPSTYSKDKRAILDVREEEGQNENPQDD